MRDFEVKSGATLCVKDEKFPCTVLSCSRDIDDDSIVISVTVTMDRITADGRFYFDLFGDVYNFSRRKNGKLVMQGTRMESGPTLIPGKQHYEHP